MKKIVLVGGGGHCKSVIDTILSSDEFDIVGITDPLSKGSILNINIIGDDSILKKVYSDGVDYAFITLGSIGNPQIRIKLYKMLKKIGFKIPNIIDKTAILASKCTLGEGVFIGKRAVINSDVKIGNNSIVNTGVIVEHDCVIEDFAHIAPGAVLSGGVYIGENSHVGSNSVVIQGIKIGSNTLIGAGTVIVKSIEDNLKVYGNPGRVR